ncbi:MAG TPA: hypothetical protein VEH06_10520 [Candidatus Bathyarchaeia archaeon]|nr:hypothetical protein [Candidatus Bathyarchaeia archaeon]
MKSCHINKRSRENYFRHNGQRPLCGTQNRLQISEVTGSNNDNSNTLVKALNSLKNTNSNTPVTLSSMENNSWVQPDLGQKINLQS